MSKINIIDHPMIQHKLTILRDKETGSKDFRELLKEISMLMGYELTRDMPLEEIEIETPMMKMIEGDFGEKVGDCANSACRVGNG